jgi:hypothetical protein
VVLRASLEGGPVSKRKEAAGCRLHGFSYTHECQGCADVVDDIAIAIQVRERDVNDAGERMTLDELIRSQGFAPDDPRLAGR